MDHPKVQRTVEAIVQALGATVEDHPAFLAIVIQLPGQTAKRDTGGVTDIVPMPSAPTSTDTGVPDLLTVKDVAAALQCSPSKVKKIVADGTLPSVNIGRLRRVRRSDLAAYINSLA